MWTHVCANFSVLLFHREVPMKEAKEFAESIAAIFIETSARNAVNVEELFQKISRFHVCVVCCVCVTCLYVLHHIWKKRRVHPQTHWRSLSVFCLSVMPEPLFICCFTTCHVISYGMGRTFLMVWHEKKSSIPMTKYDSFTVCVAKGYWCFVSVPLLLSSLQLCRLLICFCPNVGQTNSSLFLFDN